MILKEVNEKNKRGITLIALVVTIVVLLILAGVSISMLTGENGIIENAQKSKLQTEISKEKEFIDVAVSAVKISKNANADFSSITSQELQNELENLTGVGKVEVFKTGGLTVLFKDSNRTYEIDNNGEVKIDETPETNDETPGVLEGNGTEDNPYLIQSIEDLVIFSKNVENGNSYEGEFIELTTTLNFNSPNSYVNANKKYEEFGDLNGVNDIETILVELTNRDGAGFIPIGKNTNFKGVFDGNNYYIKNLYINRNSGYVGLFSQIQNATIQNLSVTGEVYGQNVAGISAGFSSESTSTIKECNNYVNLFGTKAVYGIAYCGTIINCNNYANIECDATTCCGIGYFGKIENCNNYGNMYSLDSLAGGSMYGISFTGTIINCNNFGDIKVIADSDISRVTEAEGISSFYGKVYKCNNYGELYVEIKTGININNYEAIVSGIGAAYVRDCINYGNITAIGGKIYSGGITGYIDSTKLNDKTSILYIENCCNFGNINNKMNVMKKFYSSISSGGILGETGCNVNIYNNCNYGTINSESNIDRGGSSGGIVGWLTGYSSGTYKTHPYLKNGLNAGNVNILQKVGNLKADGIGYMAGDYIEGNVYNIADVNVLGEITNEKDEITLEEMKDILNSYVSEQNNNIEDEQLKLCEWKIEKINNKDVLTLDR